MRKKPFKKMQTGGRGATRNKNISTPPTLGVAAPTPPGQPITQQQPTPKPPGPGINPWGLVTPTSSMLALFIQKVTIQGSDMGEGYIGVFNENTNALCGRLDWNRGSSGYQNLMVFGNDTFSANSEQLPNNNDRLFFKIMHNGDEIIEGNFPGPVLQLVGANNLGNSMSWNSTFQNLGSVSIQEIKITSSTPDPIDKVKKEPQPLKRGGKVRGRR